MHAYGWDIHLMSLKLIIMSHETFNQKPTFTHSHKVTLAVNYISEPVWSNRQ